MMLIRLISTLVLICLTGVAHAQQKVDDSFESYAQEVLFSDVGWVKQPQYCAPSEQCIYAQGGGLVIIKSKEKWLKTGYVVAFPGSVKWEEALFAEPCSSNPCWNECPYSVKAQYSGQLFLRADYIFKKTMLGN